MCFACVSLSICPWLSSPVFLPWCSTSPCLSLFAVPVWFLLLVFPVVVFSLFTPWCSVVSGLLFHVFFFICYDFVLWPCQFFFLFKCPNLFLIVYLYGLVLLFKINSYLHSGSYLLIAATTRRMATLWWCQACCALSQSCYSWTIFNYLQVLPHFNHHSLMKCGVQKSKM